MGSGGGGAGNVAHSAYLEAVHADWLNKSGADVIEKSITSCMNSAIGSSPWTTLNAYDPTNDIAAYEAVLLAYKVILGTVSDTDSFIDYYTAAGGVLDDAAIAIEVAAYADIIDDDLNTKLLPRFRRGMQDINAVVSSAFVIGESVIEGFRTRDIAKHASALRLKFSDQKVQVTSFMLQTMGQRIGWEAEYARNFIDSKRIKLVAKKEQIDQDMTIDEKDALWDLDVFQYGANLMAGIAGGTAMNKSKSPSPIASALGGAMSGAAAGAMAGSMIPGVGTVIGGVVGAVVGAAASLLS